MTERLYRHPTDRVIAGVAGGLAVWLNIDPSIVRIAWVLLTLVSGGLFVLVYIVMMIVVPLPPPGWMPSGRGIFGPGPGGVPGWQPGPNPWDGGWSGGGSPGWGGSAPGGATGPTGWTTPPAGDASGGAPGVAGPAGGPGPAPAWQTPPGGWPTAHAPLPVRPGNAGLIAGIVLVALGVWFLVDQYVHVNWDVMWPVLIMVAGGALITLAVMRSRTD